MSTIFQIDYPNGNVIKEELPSSLLDVNDFKKQYLFPTLEDGILVPQPNPWAAWVLGPPTELIPSAPFSMQIIGVDALVRNAAQEEYHFYAENALDVSRKIAVAPISEYKLGYIPTQSSVVKAGEKVYVRKANNAENDPSEESPIKIMVRPISPQLAPEATKYNAMRLYPQLADYTDYPYDASGPAWDVGDIVEAIPARTILDNIRILGIDLGYYADSLQGTVAKVFKGDAGEEVLVGEISFIQNVMKFTRMQAPIIPSGTRVAVQMATGLAAGPPAENYPFKIAFCRAL